MQNCVLLHVEDNDGAAFLFRFALDEAQITASLYRVTSAENAVQFLRKLNAYERAKTPRLVVIDLTLPTGRVLAGYRNEAGPGFAKHPVVVVGVEPRAEYESRVLALGAQYYIEKSFDYESFAQHAGSENLRCQKWLIPPTT